ncbi:hypothetical protein HANVADRAFT_47612 [Hanseniaspora valbyensis NRRL Y-1626]|uniref:Uncharacterized protein n=1 Tax=Hanseniaspora valbyensis NRRL Y-1626 TaxID=766949 RepID=A0A1B7TH70_9ASCO|nr:hypothetical protein HANVADRAFT_47612 [Hanseniaspora valbyensis NRRL Y-1626]
MFNHSKSNSASNSMFCQNNTTSSNGLPIILETNHENSSSSLPPLSSRNNEQEENIFMTPIHMGNNNISSFSNFKMNNYYYNNKQHQQEITISTNNNNNNKLNIPNQTSASSTSFVTDSITPVFSNTGSRKCSTNSSVSTVPNNPISMISNNNHYYYYYNNNNKNFSSNNSSSSNNNGLVLNSAYFLPKPVLISSRSFQNNNTDNGDDLPKENKFYDYNALPNYQQNELPIQGESLLDPVTLNMASFKNNNSTNKFKDEKLDNDLIKSGSASSLKRKRNLQPPPALLKIDTSREQGSSLTTTVKNTCSSKRERNSHIKRKILPTSSQKTPSKRSSSINKPKRSISVNDIINRPSFDFNIESLNHLKYDVSFESLIGKVINSDVNSLAKNEFTYPSNISSFDRKMEELIDDLNNYEKIGCGNIKSESNFNEENKNNEDEIMHISDIDLKKHYGDLLAHFGKLQ